VPAKIIVRGKRVYFRKQCPQHGEREDFVCSDVSLYDRLEYSTPAKLPKEMGVEPRLGCPYDCGLCTEHEQHTCIGLVEITSNCNLTCPMCFASSAPGGKHLPIEQCQAAIDRLVAVEGRPEVLQLSGGEPTIHPQLLEIVDYAYQQPIDYITINTNGIRFAHDPSFIKALSPYRDRLELYFQLDGLNDDVSQALRGESLTSVKLTALDRLAEYDLHVTLAVTLHGGVNNDQIGPLVNFALERPHITGINFQPATYCGRHILPDTLEQRLTFPAVIDAICEQTSGLFRRDDFMPLPCAHPNCHSLSYAYRSSSGPVPLMRIIDARRFPELLANGVTLTRAKTQAIIEQYLGRLACCGGDCGPDAGLQSSACGPEAAVVPLSIGRMGTSEPPSAADEFLQRALSQQLSAKDVFRITITSFLDAYNFDVRRLMKCCTHHILPSGHVIPFCAYNVLYREGHVALPELRTMRLVDFAQ
jgi:hypothetical protein